MKKVVIFTVAIAVVLASFVFWIRPEDSSKETIKIGVAVCLTSYCSEWGKASLNGAKLAVKEINEQGGVLGKNLELVVEDTQEEVTAKAITAYKSLRQKRDVNFIIGPSWTPAGNAIAPLAKNDPVIMISPSLGVKDFNETADNLFNLWPHDEHASRAMARYAYEQGYRRAGVFSSLQQWEELQGDVFAEEFKRLGGEVVEHVEPMADQKDVSIEAVRIVNAKPDVVFFSIYGSMGPAARELKKLGYKGPRLAILMDETRIKDAGGALDDTIFAGYPQSKPWFMESFKAEYGMLPPTSAENAYDSVKLIASAISKSGTAKMSDVKTQMNAFAEYRGASGDLSFDGKGGVTKDHVLYVVKGEGYSLYS